MKLSCRAISEVGRSESLFLLKVLLHAVHEVSLLSDRCAAMSSEEIFQHGHRKLFDRIVSKSDHGTALKQWVKDLPLLLSPSHSSAGSRHPDQKCHPQL